MFKVDHITGEGAGYLRNFCYSQESGTTHVLLSQNVEFLNELQGVLKGKMQILKGNIWFNGQKFENNGGITQSQYITRGRQIYPDQTVIENVFTDWNFGKANWKRSAEIFQRILEDTGYSVPARAKAGTLTVSDQTIVELLRCYHYKPRFLMIRELTAFISVEAFMRFLQVIRILNKSGTTVLYLTNQWEEAVKLSSDISVVINGEIQGTYSAQEVRADPSVVWYLSMGAKNLLQREKTENNEFAMLKNLNQSIQKVSIGYGVQDTIRMFSQYLIQELTANSVAIYLIDSHQNRIVDFVSDNGGAADGSEIVQRLNTDLILQLLSQNMLMAFSSKDVMFESMFSSAPQFATMLCYPYAINNDVSVFLQINYLDHYVYTKRDSMIIKWIVQEMGIYIENSQLMGSSVLLRESHHRIKNNLQIIISLLEMEKESFHNAFQDVKARASAETAFDSAVNRIKCIAGIHDLLAKKEYSSTACDIGAITKTVCDFYRENADISMEMDKILIPYAKAVSIALVINEIICNSIKHNSVGEEKIKIDVQVTKNSANSMTHIMCCDNGRGFETEEGSEQPAKTKGVGRIIIDSIVLYEFSGAMRMRNEKGAVVEIDIPDKALLPIEKREVCV